MNPQSDNTYEPRGGAKALFRCRDKEVLLVGAAGTGKTRSVCEKLNAVCLKYPNARILVLREFRIALNDTVLVTLENKVMGYGHPALNPPRDRSHRARYDYPNGASITLGGMDNPERFMSGEYDIIYLAEGTDITKEAQFDMVLSRLRNGVVPYQQAIVDCNPRHPSHWLNIRPEQCFECTKVSGIGTVYGDSCREQGHRRRMTRILSTHADNPTVTKDYLDVLAGMTGANRARLFEGKWVAAEGAIYDFRRESHVRHIPPEELAKWPRVMCGCDDGTRNPFALVRGRINGDGHLHIEAEHYAAGMVEAAKIEAARRLGVGAESIEVDPAAAGLRLAMSNASLPVHEADNDVLGGIAKVAQRFKDNRITIDPSCVNLIREIEGYEWADNDKKDQPVKEQDHACDGLKYLVARLDSNIGSKVVLAYNEPIAAKLIHPAVSGEAKLATIAPGIEDDDDRFWTKLV